MERMELVKYLEKKEKYRKIVDRLERKRGPVWRYWSWWFPKFSRVVKYWKLHEVMAFHDIRFQFIYYRNLPNDFKFSSFLRKVKTNSFIELVEIHPTHFLFMLAFTLLDIARVKSNADFGYFFEPSFLIAESVLNIVLVTVLALKIRAIYWKLTRNPATYYNEVDRRSLEEEHYIAQEVKRIAAESAPQSRRMSRTFDRKSQDGAPASTADSKDDEEQSMRKSVDMDRPRMSTDRRSRRASHAPGHAAAPSGHGHGHKPIYQNMAYVPPKSIPSSGTHTPSEHGDSNIDLEDVVARHSLDISREGNLDTSRIAADPVLGTDRPSARSSFDKPRKYEPSQTLTNKDGTPSMDAVARAAERRRSESTGRTSLEAAGRFSRTKDAPDSGRRHSNASRPRLSVDRDRRISRDRRDSSASRRTSVDLSQTLPVPELAARSTNTRPLKVKGKRHSTDDQGQMTIDVSDDGMGLNAEELRELAKKRIAEKAKPTPGLVSHAKLNEAAKSAEVGNKYPSWLVKMLPRLGRVASPAERLFWFGSPKFYLWCVEWVLFFTTVNLSATLAKVGTAAKKRSSPPKGTAKKAARFLVSVVHQAKNGTSAQAAKPAVPGVPDESFLLLMIALLIAFLTLGYVLLRIAGIMKKYIFVLNNANMIPETLTIEAIQTLRVKDIMKNNYEPMYVDGSDTEVDEGEYAQARANMSTFFSNEVQGGRMPGTAAAEQQRKVAVSSRRASNENDGTTTAVTGANSQVVAVAEAEWDGRASNV